MTVGGSGGFPDHQLTSLGLKNLQTTILFVWLHVCQQLIIAPSASLVIIIFCFFILSLLLRTADSFARRRAGAPGARPQSLHAFGTREAEFSPCPCGTCAGLPGRKSTCVHKEGRKPIPRGAHNNTTTVKTIRAAHTAEKHEAL